MTQTGKAKKQWECDTWFVNGPLIDSDPQSLLSITLDVPLQTLNLIGMIQFKCVPSQAFLACCPLQSLPNINVKLWELRVL